MTSPRTLVSHGFSDMGPCFVKMVGDVKALLLFWLCPSCDFNITVDGVIDP